MFSVLPPHESLAVFGGITEGCDRMADEKQGATDFKWDKSEGWQTGKRVQQIGSIPKENAFPGSKSQRSVSCVNTFREFLTPGIPVHLMVTQATIWGFSGGQTQYFNPLQRRALVRLFWAKQQYLLA